MNKKVSFLDDKKKLGIASYKILKLDSDILGFKTARIESINTDDSSKRILIEKLLQSFIKEKIKYATFRLSSKDLQTINLLEEKGFRLVDEYLIFIKEVAREEQKKSNSIKIREATLSDSKQLQDDLGATFIYSRFFNDPLIKKDSAIKMHKIWINNCIEGEAAEKVYVAEVSGECIGFIAVEMDGQNGHISLIGVSPKYRGRKISQQLTVHAINNWFIPKGAKLVRIETQLANIPAARAYESMGFRLAESAVTLRWAHET